MLHQKEVASSGNPHKLAFLEKFLHIEDNSAVKWAAPRGRLGKDPSLFAKENDKEYKLAVIANDQDETIDQNECNA